MARELEWKVLTDYDEFSRIYTLLCRHTGTSGKGYVQVNYYFDTPAFSLAAAHAMLRVRQVENRLLLQYKNKRKRMGSMLLCDESEEEVAALPSTVNPARHFEGAEDVTCRLVGNMVTHRTDFVFPGAVVSLDESFYLGKSDYEIEIEGEEGAIETLAAFLNPRGESKTGNGKFSRFVGQYLEYYGLKGERV